MERKIKVVGVVSSANRNGSTAALVREALKGAREKGAETQEIFLAEHRLNHCTGCLRCSSEGKCPLPDDFESIRKAVYGADGLVLGSPTYGFTFNAEYKKFLERFGMFTLFTSSLGGKYTVGISTANGNAAKKTARDILAIFKLGMFKRTYVMGTATMHKGEKTDARDDPAALKEACVLGRRLARDIITKRAYPLQNLPMRLVIRLKLRPFMRKYVINNKDGREKAVYENLLSRGLI